MNSEQLISTAKEKLGSTSASDRTIENFFSNPAFLPAEGTEPDEAYWNRTIATFKWFSDNYDGQHNHAMSTAHAAWEEQWKKEHPEPKDPPKQEPKQEQKQEQKKEPGVLTADEVAKIVAKAIADSSKKEPSAEVLELQKQMKAMMDERAAAEAKAKIDGIYSAVKSKIVSESNNGVDSALLEDAIEYIQMKGSVSKDTSVEDAEKMIRERYERQYQRYNPGGTAPYGITSGAPNGGKTFAQQWAEQRAKKLQERNNVVAAQRERFK